MHTVAIWHTHWSLLARFGLCLLQLLLVFFLLLFEGHILLHSDIKRVHIHITSVSPKTTLYSHHPNPPAPFLAVSAASSCLLYEKVQPTICNHSQPTSVAYLVSQTLSLFSAHHAHDPVPVKNHGVCIIFRVSPQHGGQCFASSSAAEASMVRTFAV